MIVSRDVMAHATFQILQVADGLTYLHDEALIHGDLRAVCPLCACQGTGILTNSKGNVLSDDHYNPMLTDFGLSTLRGAGTTTLGSYSGPSGTLRFMAPELLKGEARASFQGDMYAFGCLCIEVNNDPSFRPISI